MTRRGFFALLGGAVVSPSVAIAQGSPSHVSPAAVRHVLAIGEPKQARFAELIEHRFGPQIAVVMESVRRKCQDLQP